jgi:alpha-amylase
MATVCLYFQVHQPYRIKHYDFFKMGVDHHYEDDALNRQIMQRVAQKSYLPANKMILDLIRKTDGQFRIGLSLSGTVMEQMEKWAPEALESFCELADSGCVDFLSETYYHSLSSLYSKNEFERQILLHRAKTEELFGITPEVFRNTELLHSNDIANIVHEMGFKGILCEGVDAVLGERSPNFVYQPMWSKNFKCLIRNYRLSDDISFRFSNKGWSEYPLTANKYAGWLHKLSKEAAVINLFMDYETFGEHQAAETGIFHFMKELPEAVLAYRKLDFSTPTEALQKSRIKGIYNAPYPTSWADTERNTSAWLGNNMQREAVERVYKLEDLVLKSQSNTLLNMWSKLQTSDHFYYMSTKHFGDGEVHQYFSPYNSPYDAYINYMNVLTDFEDLLQKSSQKEATNDGVLV